MNTRTLAKFCLLLVVIGFFMPMSCDMNGFEIADMAGEGTAVCLYGLFVCAVLGVIIGGLLMMQKPIPILVDWIAVLGTAGFGAIPFFKNIDGADGFQTGVWVVMAGTIAALVLQILYHFKK